MKQFIYQSQNHLIFVHHVIARHIFELQTCTTLRIHHQILQYQGVVSTQKNTILDRCVSYNSKVNSQPVVSKSSTQVQRIPV